MSAHWKEPRAWLHGLIAGAIGGGATAVTAAVGTNTASTLGVDVHTIDLKQMGAIFLSSVAFNALLYLKQSPLPELEVTVSAVTVEETRTVTTSTTNEPTEPQTKTQ